MYVYIHNLNLSGDLPMLKERGVVHHFLKLSSSSDN